MASSAAEQQLSQPQQQSQKPQQQQKQTTLEFYQAMSDFKNMFPQMDDDVIEAVLRANQGAVDTTIDQLLSMSTDNENEQVRSEIEQTEQGVWLRPELNGSLQRWRPPMLGPLPEAFLRLNQTNEELDCLYLEDERIAVFLQNEEFMAELRWNQDFMSTLENDSKLQSKSDSVTEDDLFRERLRNMGKASRRKFAQLTRVFTRSKKRAGRQLLPATASCDDLLGQHDAAKSG
ncbi:CUE domain-containing protein 1 [Trichogramma pretiosum]|uniref:CUE domain-containing protein 1 n=1 Tax=Trichogramma pretiosum TaxID=7493 RepID=UPI0006C9D1D0|nr:CUE domain-containing protein 1 [Trichogramma pretiosum]